MREPEDEADETLRHGEMAPLDLPVAPRRGSLVPRWLAWIVLIALLGAAALSVWQLFGAATR